VARYVLIHHSEQEHVLPESPLPSEARLHDALELHPELFPAEDLNLGQLLVVGREVAFESGAADLIYLDEDGQIVVVEVKRGTENPDSRRVVAQMLDYGAHLWRMGFEDFEARIALPYLRQRRSGATAASSLTEIAAEQFAFGETTDPEQFRNALTAHLAAGTFIYAVVARTLPPTLATVLEYLAAVSQIQTAAITVDYFRDEDRHIMVPRVAFASATRRPPPPPPPRKTTAERFLEDVGEAAPYWASFLEFLGSLPGRFFWGERGFSYRLVVDGKQYPILWAYPRTTRYFKTHDADELIILVEAEPSRPKQLRRSIAAIEPSLREQPGAVYKRTGNDQAASVTFRVQDQLAQEPDRAIRSALSRIFATRL
jgi:hypothetical protein